MRDRRAERFAATCQEILDAAWDIAREIGLTAVAMREVGARVGMRAQSLYVYFPSKNAVYDAMFAAANQELLRRLQHITGQPDPTGPSDPTGRVRALTRLFVEFATEDPVRYQLLYQRPIPGFEPSPQSYALARGALDTAAAALTDVGVTDPADLDLYTALVAGVVAQQNANDPGGQRWTRQLDRVLDLFFTALTPT